MTRFVILLCALSTSAVAQTTLRLHAAQHPITGYLSATSDPGAGRVESVTNTVKGPAQVQLTGTAPGTVLAWISPPVAQSVQLDSNILFSIWGKVGSRKANVGYTVALAIYRNGVLLSNFTWGSPTSALTNQARQRLNIVGSGSNPTLQVGDRLVVRVYLKDSGGVMLGGQTVTTYFDATTADDLGDTYLRFEDTIVFSLGM